MQAVSSDNYCTTLSPLSVAVTPVRKQLWSSRTRDVLAPAHFLRGRRSVLSVLSQGLGEVESHLIDSCCLLHVPVLKAMMQEP